MNQIITVIILVFVACSAYSQNTIVSLTGSIKNDLTKEPIGIDIRLINSEGKQVGISKSNSKDGYYFITGLRPDSIYYLRFNDFNYMADSHEFQVPNTRKYQEYSRDFLVKPKKEGVKFTIKVPPFDIGKSKIRPGSDFFLKDLVNLMKFNKRVEFVIKSYPDNSKDPALNMQLTTDRAKSLQEYFINNGIEIEHLKVEGSSDLDSENPPPTGKQAKGKKYIGTIYLIVTKI